MSAPRNNGRKATMANDQAASVQSELESFVKKTAALQNGILGIPLGSGIANVDAFAVKGVLINGTPYLRCDLTLKIYFPSTLTKVSTDYTCDIDGVDVKLDK